MKKVKFVALHPEDCYAIEQEFEDGERGPIPDEILWIQDPPQQTQHFPGHYTGRAMAASDGFEFWFLAAQVEAL